MGDIIQLQLYINMKGVSVKRNDINESVTLVSGKSSVIVMYHVSLWDTNCILQRVYVYNYRYRTRWQTIISFIIVKFCPQTTPAEAAFLQNSYSGQPT